MTKNGKVEFAKPMLSGEFMTAAEQDRGTDVIVIGGGAAGMSAALWCAELKLRTILFELETELGGQLLRVYNPIKNYLGIETENGHELRDTFVKQIEKFDFQIQTDTEITGINVREKQICLQNGKTYSAKAIIIATGVRRRKLNVEGEAVFQNRGIIESGKRDAEIVTGKSVAVIGGGDAAAENALILSETAAEVYLIHRGRNFSARPEFTEKIPAHKNIKILLETVVEKISGDENIDSVELKDKQNNRVYQLPVDAVLLRIGVEPNTKLFRNALKLDQKGYIEVDAFCETDMENIFAVGDVANRIAPTVSSAVGMGATAAKMIFQKLNLSDEN